MSIYEGCNLYTKKPIDRNELMNKLNLDKEDVLFVDQVDDWIKRKNENVVIECNGRLDDEDEEEYPGFYYYNVSIFGENIKQKFAGLKDSNIIVDMQ